MWPEIYWSFPATFLASFMVRPVASGYATNNYHHRLCGSQPYSSVADSRALRNSDADLAIIAQRSRMKREHRIAIYIVRDCLFRRRLSLHQLIAMVKDRRYEFINEVIRQVLVRDREVVEPNRVIILSPRTIGAGRNQGRRDFGHLVSHYGTL